ncbi:MAG: hypothetical protein OXH38_12730 [Chloroflexi bacterium]|nr:hypothetical protein [Chloroflexota bacterium]
MAKQKTVDPRLELVNFDVLDMDKFPPVEEWTEDDWEEAGLLTLAAMAEAERIEQGLPMVTEAAIEAEFGPLDA